MFTETLIENVFKIDGIYTVHYFDYTKDFNFEGESHDFWELVFIDSGSALVTAENRCFDILSGQAVFHRPGEFHSIKANGNYAGVVIITFSTKSPNAKYLEGLSLKLNSEQRDCISRILTEASKTFAGPMDIVDQKALITLSDAPFGALQLIGLSLEQLVISIIRTLTQKENTVTSEAKTKDNVIVTKIQKMLEENLYGQISLDRISEELNFSKSYLKTHFKAVTGYSIYQTYIQMKISLSKKLLAEGNCTVTQISDMLSFSSVHHFSKTFSKYVGMPPVVYARSVKGRALL